MATALQVCSGDSGLSPVDAYKCESVPLAHVHGVPDVIGGVGGVRADAVAGPGGTEVPRVGRPGPPGTSGGRRANGRDGAGRAGPVGSLEAIASDARSTPLGAAGHRAGAGRAVRNARAIFADAPQGCLRRSESRSSPLVPGAESTKPEHSHVGGRVRFAEREGAAVARCAREAETRRRSCSDGYSSSSSSSSSSSTSSSSVSSTSSGSGLAARRRSAGFGGGISR